MEPVYDRGVYLAGLDLWLDSRISRACSLISHAHTDHIGRHWRPIATSDTLRLLQPIWGKATPLALEYGQSVDTPMYTLSLHPSGHMLGAAQALVVSKATGERLLYTGDLKVRSNPTSRPLEHVACDTLVLDATYGRPCYTFPPEGEVLAQMEDTLKSWLASGHTPVVLGYPRGKAQELLHHLLDRGFSVVVEERVYLAAKAYEESGVCFPGAYRSFQKDQAFPLKDGDILLASTSARRSGLLEGLSRLRLMSLTGWSVHRNGAHRLSADAALPFSDHADYNDLVGYVKRVAPKRVFTIGSFPDLAQHLCKLGYEAYHMGLNDPTRQLPLF